MKPFFRACRNTGCDRAFYGDTAWCEPCQRAYRVGAWARTAIIVAGVCAWWFTGFLLERLT